MKRGVLKTQTSLYRFMLGMILMISLAAGTATGAEKIDQNADTVLKSMSSYLAKTKAFSMDAEIDIEVITGTGQKLQLSSAAAITMERPSKLYITRKGMISDAVYIFDGETLTVHGKNLNIYAQINVPGTIDDAIQVYEFETGLPAPGADLLFSNPYAVLSPGVESGIYVGKAYVDGVECHHLAFREQALDWQLWIKAGDKPLPMKYVITSKWQTAAPQYVIRFRNWNTKPIIKADQFSFSIPDGAMRLETIPVDETGELTTEKEDKQ